jgi:hypothetical protein
MIRQRNWLARAAIVAMLVIFTIGLQAPPVLAGYRFP